MTRSAHRSSRALGLFLMVVLLVAACSSGGDKDNDATKEESGRPTVGTVTSTIEATTPPLPTAPGTVTVPPSVSGPPNSAALLNENRARWDRERPDRYTFTYEVECACPVEVAGPFTVTVEGDTIVASDGPAASGELLPRAVSIDGLFDLIDNSIGELARVEVTYDPTYGYPTEILLGQERVAAETDQTHRITAFTAG